MQEGLTPAGDSEAAYQDRGFRGCIPRQGGYWTILEPA